MTRSSDFFCYPYSRTLDNVWDEIVRESMYGCFLQSRSFLSYHGDEFQDASIVIGSTKTGRPLAVFPAATVNESVISHPGATFGGLVPRSIPSTRQWIAMLDAVLSHYRGAGHTNLLVTPMPGALTTHGGEGQSFACWHLHGQLERRQPNYVVPTAVGDLGRRHERRRGHRLGVRVKVNADPKMTFNLIIRSLRERHGIGAVHSLDEILLLKDRLGNAIQFCTAEIDSEALAAAVIFDYGACWHTQYLGTTDEGRKVNALDVLLEDIAIRAKAAGRDLSLGIATDQSGLYLNEGLAAFKESLGGRIHNTDRFMFPFRETTRVNV